MLKKINIIQPSNNVTAAAVTSNNININDKYYLPELPNNVSKEEITDSKREFMQLANQLKNYHIDVHQLDINTHIFSCIDLPKKNAIEVKIGSRNFIIHANKVVMPDNKIYIASQYPQNHNNFWQACLQEQPNLIVDLTRPNTGNGIDGKNYLVCYYPENVDQSILFNNIEIICNTKEQQGNILIFGLTIYNKITNSAQKLTRIHYQDWEDHNSSSADNLLKLADTIDKHIGDKPPFIHCAAGVGRTGTLITILVMRNLDKNNSIKPDEKYKKLRETILFGRMQRGKIFVQNPDQLQTIVDITKKLCNT